MYFTSKTTFELLNKSKACTNLKLTMFIGNSDKIKPPLFWIDDVIDDVMTGFLMLKNDHLLVAVSQRI